MSHGIKQVFEVVGEYRLVAGAAPPGQGFRFGRMFPLLPWFQPTTGALAELGERMTGTAAPAPDDGLLAAGYTYFGQFIDHDITRDQAGGDQPPAAAVPDFDPVQLRSPSLDLDSLYGDQIAWTSLVEPGDITRMRIGTTVGFAPAGAQPNDPVHKAFPNDVPRSAEAATLGAAQIGDNRNDENLIVSQLHLAFLKFHNKAAAVLVETSKLKGEVLEGDELFKATRKLVTEHYQWLVLNDFVRHLTDPDVFADVLKFEDITDIKHKHTKLTPKVFTPTAFETPPMPLEFSVAAYRLGHSMIRNGYPWNRFFPGGGNRGATLEELFIFTNTSGFLGRGGPPTLPSNWIVDWRKVFDFTTIKVGAHVNPAGIVPAKVKKLDTHLAPFLGNLPRGGGNLATRNLQRGRHLAIPSGQAIAEHLVELKLLDKKRVLTPDQIVNGTDAATALDDETKKVLQENEFDLRTPLWFYILREAALAGGLHLGPVGSRIMVETFVGLIRCSLISIFNADHDHPGFLKVFSPELDSPLRTPEGEPITTMAHLLVFVDDINPLGDFAPTPAPPDPLTLEDVEPPRTNPVMPPATS